MTLDQFLATKLFVKDLRTHPTLDFWAGTWDDAPEPPKGLVYVGCLVIEEIMPSWPATTRARGRWYLILGNMEYVSDDLPMLERELYDYAKGEGLCDQAGGS